MRMQNGAGEASSEGKELIYLGWLPKELVLQMNEKTPGLVEKLSSLEIGEKPSLSEMEKNFFVDLIMNEPAGKAYKYGDIIPSNIITGLARQIWGAGSAHWESPRTGEYMQENVAAAFWHSFGGLGASRSSVVKLVDFYLGTTRKEAEQQMSKQLGYPIEIR